MFGNYLNMSILREVITTQAIPANESVTVPALREVHFLLAVSWLGVIESAALPPSTSLGNQHLPARQGCGAMGCRAVT